MNIVGLITEYNPFHNGHLFHLENSKEKTNCEYSVAVMSGNFVQRGEPALLDKWTRAKMAVENGVDLIIELPTIYACQSAEYFAYGAVNILNSLGVVDFISFGSESGDLKILSLIADILYDEPLEFKNYLKEILKTGILFPEGRTKALIKYINNHLSIQSYHNKAIKDALSNPNNILAIEYLKALKKMKSDIIPVTIRRIGAHYNSQKISDNISSATAIRNELFHKNSTKSIQETLPIKSYNIINNAWDMFRSYNRLENYNEILLYLLRTITPQRLKNILDVEEGLENRIIKYSHEHHNISKILDSINTKRYTYTRLKRILIHILLDINQTTFLTLHAEGPQYIRVLAFNKKGIEILNKAKKISSLPIITKFANYKRFNNPNLNQMIQYDKKATDIFFLGLKNYKKNKSNLDYYISPYMKKDD